MQRRQFLLASALGCVANPVWAQANDFRALVAVVLDGGNDAFNSFVPSDSTRYEAYARARGAVALPRAELVPLTAELSLHPRLQPLAGLWNAQQLAIVHNVGPLARPTNGEDLAAWDARGDYVLLPDALYSHFHQICLWEAGGVRAAQPYSWIARLTQRLSVRSSTFSLAGNRRLTAGLPGGALALPLPGVGYDAGALNHPLGDVRGRKRRAAFDALLAATDTDNQLRRAFANQQRTALLYARELDALLRQAPGPSGTPDAANPELSEAFGHFWGAAGGTLSRQLYQVAKTLKSRALVGGSRHFYVVVLGGFDTHAQQRRLQDPLLAELARALTAFQTALERLGLHQQVTTFTLSEFGRTLVANGSAGTDHGWGGDQLVLGGAVLGGRSVGQYPSLHLGASDDTGFGRWIPSSAVDQYAATLLRWWGADEPTLDAVFSNLRNFPRRDLGFMRPD
jgi:uncharacterized protein (DUF1501 family)